MTERTSTVLYNQTSDKMKKIFIIVLSLTTLFWGCEKERVTTLAESSNSTEKYWEDPPHNKVCCYNYETSSIPNGNEYCCQSGKGCAPCAIIIVEPGGGGPKGNNHLAMVNDLLGEDPAEVAAFFATKSNFEDIFPLLYGTDIHDNLCTGNYIMSNIIHAYHSNNCVFQFTNTIDNTLIAVPYAEE